MNLGYARINLKRSKDHFSAQIKRKRDEKFHYDELTVKQKEIFASCGFYLYRIRMINVLLSDKPDKISLKHEYKNINFIKGNKKYRVGVEILTYLWSCLTSQLDLLDNVSSKSRPLLLFYEYLNITQRIVDILYW